MSDRTRSFRLMIDSLANLPPVVINGDTYTGQALAMQVAVDANQPIEEGARTSQLISEIGRVTAQGDLQVEDRGRGGMADGPRCLRSRQGPKLVDSGV
mgnify:CR=1 FL=1